MKNYLRTVLYLIISFVVAMISACHKESRWDCVKRTGKTTTDTRILPSFTKIRVEGNVNVFITQGNVQEVKVEAGNNLISLIKTEVDSATLLIQNNNRCNWARSYKNGTINVYITMPELIHILHNGSGLIKSSDTITCDVLTVMTTESGDVDLLVNATAVYTQLHSTADVTISGKCIYHGNFHIGEGILHCENLLTEFTWSQDLASGDEFINVNTSLAVTIDWVGNIYYTGSPGTVNNKGTGKGKLIRQD